MDLFASVTAVNDDQFWNTEDCSTSISESTSISLVFIDMLTFHRVDESPSPIYEEVAVT